MKALLLITALAFAPAVWADTLSFEELLFEKGFRAGCATSTAEIANISDLIAKVSPWGNWSGTWDGKAIALTLNKGGSKFTGTATYNGSNYGPNNVTICDYGGTYSVTVLGYQFPLEVISSKKIRLTSPLNSSDKIVLTRN
ncbi:MAG: hypothetical protein K2Q26_03150 [Bdellovibrionales bacterium]|nr:hypothetical protein [Bdellovibrionales bacterium]